MTEHDSIIERGDASETSAIVDQLERMQADGRISPDDADHVRTFADFLRAAGPGPKHPDFDRDRFSKAYRDHYPEDYEKAITEERARLAASNTPNDKHEDN